MPIPAQVVQWLAQTYPRPRIDSEWLEACCDWIIEELSLNPNNATDLPRLIENVELQLLQSDLRDSAVAGTGLPTTLGDIKHGRLGGAPVLVEIAAMTEIGSSAFQLQTVRQTRVDRADLAGLNADRGEDGQAEEEDEGPVPRYPRSMLRLELTDGTTMLKAVEYRRLPQLVLGETPLGYKLLLKNVVIRRGIAFLEPTTVILKGHQTQDREATQDIDFVRGLRLRMGLPEDDPDAPPAENNPPPPPPPAPRAPDPAPAHPAPMPDATRAIAARHLPPPENPRPPFRELSPSAMEAFFDDDMEDEEDIRAKDRKVPVPAPSTTTTQATAGPSQVQRVQTAASTQRTLVASPYWAAGAPSTASAGPSTLATLASERVLSPPRGRMPLFLPDDDDEPESQSVASAAARQARDDAGGSDYDFMDDSLVIDDAVLAEIAAVEAASQPPMRGSSATVSDVITIESDGESDGKENVPVAPRNVRRKIKEEKGAPRGRSPAVTSDDVIDISD